MKTLFTVLLKKHSWLIINVGPKSKLFDLHALITISPGPLDSNIECGSTFCAFGFMCLFHAYDYDRPLTIYGCMQVVAQYSFDHISCNLQNSILSFSLAKESDMTMGVHLADMIFFFTLQHFVITPTRKIEA